MYGDEKTKIFTLIIISNWLDGRENGQTVFIYCPPKVDNGSGMLMTKMGTAAVAAASTATEIWVLLIIFSNTLHVLTSTSLRPNNFFHTLI